MFSFLKKHLPYVQTKAISTMFVLAHIRTQSSPLPQEAVLSISTAVFRQEDHHSKAYAKTMLLLSDPALQMSELY